LIEVILAISIAIGILIVALSFYRQATDLRGQLLREAERLSDIRLLLDHLTADLRAARSGGSGFNGETASLSFLKAGLGFGNSWTSAPAGDLKWVAYHATTALDGTNLVVSGIVRTEVASARMLATEETRPSTVTPVETVATNSPVSTNAASAIVSGRSLEPLSTSIRFLQFRYWDGETWADAWNSIDPPTGVEVTVGSEPLPQEALSAEYPFETFRRVIFLPGGRVVEPKAPAANP
jgi:hypothetical protein